MHPEIHTYHESVRSASVGRNQMFDK